MQPDCAWMCCKSIRRWYIDTCFNMNATFLMQILCEGTAVSRDAHECSFSTASRTSLVLFFRTADAA